MKNESTTIHLKTRGHGDSHDLTPKVSAFLTKIKAVQGTVTVSVVGSTASIGTLEFEPGLQKDLPEFLDKILPRGDYHHNATWSDDNGHSHLRSTLLGTSQVFPVIGGKLALGTWQQIFLADFDTSARERKIVLLYLGS